MRINVRESLPSPFLPMSSARQGVASSGPGAQRRDKMASLSGDDGAHP
jgi:hypothetical protein